MLLEDILNQAPESDALLLRRDTYGEDQRAALVRDVLALANAAAGEIRHLLFGAEAADGKVAVHGLDRDAIERFRQLGSDLATLIEPPLRVAPLLAEMQGKRVAALEISDCGNPPYTLRQRITDDMRTGACWVRDLDDVRPARREDLDRIYARRAAQPSLPVEIGLNDDPACLQLRLPVPDSSQPPSQRARDQLLSAINAKKTANRMLGNEDTAMARLAHARIFGADTPFVQRGMDTLIEQYNRAADEYAVADRHYYYEQQAVKLSLAIRNCQPVTLENLQLEFSLPQLSGFVVADRLYGDADGGRTAIESQLAGYPEVSLAPDRATVRVNLEGLAPGQQRPVFETPLRIRVGPEMRGMKVAMKYRLTAAGLNETLHGRLKLVFMR